jgi:hypothetical protein
MPIFDDSFIDTAAGSSGPRSSFLEGVSSGYDQQYVVDSELSIQMEVLERWNENLVQIETQTGERFNRVSPDLIDTYRKRRAGEDVLTSNEVGGFFGGFFTGASGVGQRDESVFAELERQNAAMVAAGLPDFDTLLQETFDLQRKVEDTSALVSETGGLSATLGQLVGGVGGSFTLRDPTTLVTLPLGGVGKTAAMRIATEAVAAGGVEALLQFGPVAENRRTAGLPEGNPLQNVLLAAGGAAALRGLFEGVGAGARALRRNVEPEVSLDFEDAQLRQFLGERPNSPNARAGLDMLDDDAALEAASPYGTSYQGLRRFSAEVAEAEMAILGRSDTAVGRVLPDLPRETLEREADFQIVRDMSPAVAERADVAKARVVELEQQVAGIAKEVEGRTVIDAVRRVSAKAADELEQLAARTDIPEEAKQLEADLIFNRVGKDKILRAAEDAEIAPRKQTQRLQKQRRAAVKELRAATRAMEAERAKLTAAADRVKAMMQGEAKDLLGYAIQTRPLQGSRLASEQTVAQRTAIAKDADTLPDRAGDTLTATLTPTAGPVNMVSDLKEGMGDIGKAIAGGYIDMLYKAAKAGKITDVNGTTLPALQALKIISDGGVKITRAITDRVVRAVDRLTSKGEQFSADMRSIVLDELNTANGVFEIAPGVVIRSDFLVPNDAGELVPIGPLMKEFDEDARLVEAMRSCAL